MGVVGSQAKAARAGDGYVFLVWRGDGEKGSPLPYALTFAICLGFFLFGLNVGDSHHTPQHTWKSFAFRFCVFFFFISLTKGDGKMVCFSSCPHGALWGWPRESVCGLKEIRQDRKEVGWQCGEELARPPCLGEGRVSSLADWGRLASAGFTREGDERNRPAGRGLVLL